MMQMSQSRNPNGSGGLAKLPIDVLLKIFDNCDIADILCLALTCKELRTATEERHVWFTQFKRCCAAFLQAPFRSRTKELHLRSTAQLKSWAIQQARTDALWVQDKDHLEFQNIRVDNQLDICFSITILLPGGEYLVVFTDTITREFVLKKIERGKDNKYSGWRLTDVARYIPPRSGQVKCSDNVFTDTICEYPLITYDDDRDASVTIFHLDYDSGTISVQQRLQVNPCGGVAGYGTRRVCIRGDTILWFYRDFDFNDGHHEHLVVAKLDDPNGIATRQFHLDWDSLKAEYSDYEILTANAFIRYDYYGIYLYHIPHLSPGIQSQGGSGEPTSPSVVWSSQDRSGFHRYGGLYYDRTDAVLPSFYLHNDRHSRYHIIEFGMNTVEDAEHDPCAGYPVVLNHTVTPTNNDSIRIRGPKGRKRARVNPHSTLGEFRINTLFVDDPGRCGHFCTDLRQYGVPDVVGQPIQTMEYDEITGRILLQISGATHVDTLRIDPDRLLLADLPRPGHENSH